MRLYLWLGHSSGYALSLHDHTILWDTVARHASMCKVAVGLAYFGNMQTTVPVERFEVYKEYWYRRIQEWLNPAKWTQTT